MFTDLLIDGTTLTPDTDTANGQTGAESNAGADGRPDGRAKIGGNGTGRAGIGGGIRAKPESPPF